MRNRALMITAPEVVEWVDIPVARPDAGEVLVRPLLVGICGTDYHFYTGESAYLQKGFTQFPIRFGHEWVGRVEAVGDRVDSHWLGSRVTSQNIVACGQCQTCRAGTYNLCPHRQERGVRGRLPGAACAYIAVPVSELVVVPDALSDEGVVTAEPCITVLHAFERTGLQPGESLAVIGAGTLGLAATQIAKAMGCWVTVVDPVDVSRAAALSAGADLAISPDEVVSGMGGNAHVIVESSGSPRVGPAMASLAQEGTRVGVIGIPGSPTSLDLADVVIKGVSLYGVLGGPHLLANALAVVAAGMVNPGLLIDGVFPADESVAAFGRMAASGRPRPKVMIRLTSVQ